MGVWKRWNGTAYEYVGLQNAAETVDVDNAVIDDSYNPVSSDAVFHALQQKKDASAILPHTFNFILHLGEDAVVGTDKCNWINVPHNMTIDKVVAVCKVPPVGASLIMDICVNGTTIWSTQANRVKILSGDYSGSSTTFDTASLVEGNVLTIDIDQVGSSTPGQSITVQVRCI